MKNTDTRTFILAAAISVALPSCAFDRTAMSRYHANHPEMQAKFLDVRTIYVDDVKGARGNEESSLVRARLIEEINRKGRGRFRIVGRREKPDALLQADMEEELGPTSLEKPLIFELEQKAAKRKDFYLRIKLVDPITGRLIYKTDTKELPEFKVDSAEKAAHTVVRNLMNEIDLASRISP